MNGSNKETGSIIIQALRLIKETEGRINLVISMSIFMIGLTFTFLVLFNAGRILDIVEKAFVACP